MRKIITLLMACATAVAVQAGSGKSEKAADISLDSLKEVISAGSATIIDVNGSKSYQKGHIPGAVDFQSVKDDLADALPQEKDALIVAYCGNQYCGAYQRATQAAVALGYTNVVHYSGGIEGWKKAGEATEPG